MAESTERLQVVIAEVERVEIMLISLPVYVEELRSASSPITVYKVRPLFFIEPFQRDEVLSRAISKLVNSLRRLFDSFAKEMRHDTLALYTFCPKIEEHFLKFIIDTGDKRTETKYLIIVTEALERKIAFSPNIPGLFFEVERGETLQDRASNAINAHFKELLKKEGSVFPEKLSVEGKASTTTVEMEIFTPQLATRPEEIFFAMLGGKGEINATQELSRVGRCLDWDYPDDLNRATYRENEVKQLQKYLTTPDKRPVLILGARMSGKTTLIHEYVYRSVDKKYSRHSLKNNTWLLSPQRLISGMSYVGQWENRLLAIIKELQEKDHIIYFDDVLGLFYAGITSQSSLSVAHVLKPYIERREIRVVAEMTHESFRVLQEKDRGFADLFQILHLQAASEEENLKIQISLVRELERQHKCNFSIDSLPVAIDLQCRYVRDAALPGKVSLFLQQLAVKHKYSKIDRETIIEEFHAKSGLSVSFLDGYRKLERAQVVTALSKEIVGQKAVIEAASDVISIAKAKLNDPDRPLASFLFLGPTGVGKTQSAKAIAKYLFGDAEKMIRFDMNEFVSANSVTKLVGNFSSPEGLLTSAVRRQPFSVILLDEIEKAHKDLFDLLLQVIGEGRLTDAIGRTVDFTNTIIILTSNLGVKEANATLGFHKEESSEKASYTQAARKFFRPEFFNRIDRIVPFDRLDRKDIDSIARRLIAELFTRDGFVRRKCIVQIEELAMEKIIDQGYHPVLGARALKRAIERELTQPIASQLVNLTKDSPAVITVLLDGEAKSISDIKVQVDGLTEVVSETITVSEIPEDDQQRTIDRIAAVLERIDKEIAVLQPTGAINTENVSQEHKLYFALKEQSRRVANIITKASAKLVRRETTSQPVKYFAKNRKPFSKQIVSESSARRLWHEISAAQDVHIYLRELTAELATNKKSSENPLANALREVALLDLIAKEGKKHQRALIHIASIDETRIKEQRELAKLYKEFFATQIGLETEFLDYQSKRVKAASILLIQGSYSFAMCKIEQGTHLFYPPHENLLPVQVNVIFLATEDDPKQCLESFLQKSRSLLPVVRVYDERGSVVDLRTGTILQSNSFPTFGELRAMILGALPAIDELI